MMYLLLFFSAGDGDAGRPTYTRPSQMRSARRRNLCSQASSACQRQEKYKRGDYAKHASNQKLCDFDGCTVRMLYKQVHQILSIVQVHIHFNFITISFLKR